MNRVYIISYDLGNPGRNYEALLQRIQAYGAWARLGGSAYLILTNQTTAQVRDNLIQVMDGNDKIYVGLLGNSAAWAGLGEQVSNWIRNNQK